MNYVTLCVFQVITGNNYETEIDACHVARSRAQAIG